MKGLLGIQTEADRQAMNRDAMNVRGGMLREDPSLMQRVGGTIADYAVPDRYVKAFNPSVMSPRLESDPNLSMQDMPDMSPMLMDMMPGAGIAGIFAGVGSKTANKLALQKAQDLTGQGFNRNLIWDETGWFNDVDGKWKYEIDDSWMQHNPHNLEARPGATSNDYASVYRSGKMEEGLEHRELQEAYPNINEMELVDFPWEGSGGRAGTYARTTINGELDFGSGETISMYASPNRKSVLAHELQHAVQQREGFGSGGSPRPELQSDYWEKYASDFKAGNGPELLKEHNQLSRVIQDLNHTDRINDFRNIKQPRQLFNSTDFYEKSQELRRALGSTPKSGPKRKKWAQDAGNMLADMLEEERINRNTNRFAGKDQAEIKKVLRNANAKNDRLNKKGVWPMKSLRSKMDDADPFNNPWDTKRLNKAYLDLAGEAEARNAQTRMDFTLGQRQAQPPWETLDVPEKDLLVKLKREY